MLGSKSFLANCPGQHPWSAPLTGCQGHRLLSWDNPKCLRTWPDVQGRGRGGERKTTRLEKPCSKGVRSHTGFQVSSYGILHELKFSKTCKSVPQAQEADFEGSRAPWGSWLPHCKTDMNSSLSTQKVLLEMTLGYPSSLLL